MVTMMTEMIGSPISRRRKMRSTLIAMKKSAIMLRKKATAIGSPTQTARA